MMPRVSIIIPAFNAAALIGRAVKSAQAQSEQAIEIIVVDDLSTDNTVELVERLASQDGRVRLLRMERNGGPGQARNAGLAAARGDWIALLDADDRYHPRRLETLLQAGIAHNAQLVADNLLLVALPTLQSIGLMIPAEWLSEARVVSAAEYVEGNIRKKAQQRIGYGYLKPIIQKEFLAETEIRYDDLRFSEDYIFVLRCLIADARYVVLPDAMYDYAVGTDGLTTGHSADDLARLSHIERTLLADVQRTQNPPLQDAMQRHIRSVELALGWFRFAQAIKRGDPAAALSQAFQSPAQFRHISSEGLRAVPRALRHKSRRTPA